MSSLIRDFRLRLAEDEIKKQYGDVVSILTKAKTLRKFGQNADLDADVEEQIWALGGSETLPTGNTINTLVSTNAGDTQTVTIEGHTVDSDGDFTFVTQSLTLNGTTDVALTTNLARANRIFNTGSTDFAGTVTVRVDGGATHLSTGGASNQSLKAATTISKDDYYIVTQVIFSTRRANNGTIDFRVQVREKGSVFRTKISTSTARDSGTIVMNMDPCLIIPKNSDIRALGTASAANMQGDVTFNGYLASIIRSTSDN